MTPILHLLACHRADFCSGTDPKQFYNLLLDDMKLNLSFQPSEARLVRQAPCEVITRCIVSLSSAARYEFSLYYVILGLYFFHVRNMSSGRSFVPTVDLEDA